jgi:hypothetical protein
MPSPFRSARLTAFEVSALPPTSVQTAAVSSTALAKTVGSGGAGHGQAPVSSLKPGSFAALRSKVTV